MTDAYLRNVLNRYSHSLEYKSGVPNLVQPIINVIRGWGTNYIGEIQLSGSLAKGTSVTGGTDIDLFISLIPTTPYTMKEIYDTLHAAVNQAGFQPRKQRVSIGMTYGGNKIDLVPAKQQDGRSENHTLHRNDTGNWTLTNVQSHIRTIQQSGRTEEIKLTKIWRNRFSLDFPSFYLELAVLRALHGKPLGQLHANMIHALQFVRDDLHNARIVDPANTNNVISDGLLAADKANLARYARESLNCTDWQRVIS